ncbi:MAG: preprotein translocase subunit SecE [Deltaproteobacteria bacterium]|nr:preprotein translocase subunit SecE [Deltaproteobacteria bacterium]
MSKEAQSDTQSSKTGGVGQLVTQGREFLNEAVAELRRVYWPTRKETMAFTWIVIIVVGFVSLYLGVVDYVISLGMRLVF